MWIRVLSTTKYVSAHSIWKMSHIINIVETWEHENNADGKIQGFILIEFTWNHKN